MRNRGRGVGVSGIAACAETAPEDIASADAFALRPRDLEMEAVADVETVAAMRADAAFRIEVMSGFPG
jgi:hypothetical protein